MGHTSGKVARIRAIARSGQSAASVAQMFGMSESSAMRIILGQTYGDLPDALTREEYSYCQRNGLSDEDVIYLRGLAIRHSGHLDWEALSSLYGVGVSYIRLAVRGRTYRHLNAEAAPVAAASDVRLPKTESVKHGDEDIRLEPYTLPDDSGGCLRVILGTSVTLASVSSVVQDAVDKAGEVMFLCESKNLGPAKNNTANLLVLNEEQCARYRGSGLAILSVFSPINNSVSESGSDQIRNEAVRMANNHGRDSAVVVRDTKLRAIYYSDRLPGDRLVSFFPGTR